MNMDLAGYSLFNAQHVDGLVLGNVVWCDANNARATADGSVGDPLPSIQGAIDLHVTRGITDGEPRVIIAKGYFDEDLLLPSRGSFEVIPIGSVWLGNALSPRNITRVADPADQVPGSPPSLQVHGSGRGSLRHAAFVVTGKVLLSDTGAGQAQTFVAHNCTILALGSGGLDALDGSGHTLALVLNVSDSVVYGMNALTALLVASHVDFQAPIICATVAMAQMCEFDDVTVTAAPSGLPLAQLAGFYDCAIPGDFTGPAGSLLCDNVTASIFTNGSGTLLGGATILLVENGIPHAAEHNEGGAQELTVQDLGSAAATAGQRLVADGTGGWDLSSIIDCGTF